MKQVQVGHWNRHPTVEISIVLMSLQAPIRISANVSIHASCNQKFNATTSIMPPALHYTTEARIYYGVCTINLHRGARTAESPTYHFDSIAKPFSSYSRIWINRSFFKMGTANVSQPFTHHVHAIKIPLSVDASGPLLRLHCASFWWLTLRLIRLHSWSKSLELSMLTAQCRYMRSAWSFFFEML